MPRRKKKILVGFHPDFACVVRVIQEFKAERERDGKTNVMRLTPFTPVEASNFSKCPFNEKRFKSYLRYWNKFHP